MNELIVYTSDECAYCSTAEKRLKEVLAEYGDLFTLKFKKVSPGSSEEDITVLPTLVMGKKRLEGSFEEDQIHTLLFS